MKNLKNIQKSSLKPNKKSKEIYYKLYFQENKHNLFKVWNRIKETILIKKVQPKCLKIDHNLINDCKKNVYEFNIFFRIIAKNIDKKNAAFLKAIFKLPEKLKNKFATVEPCYRKIDF